MLNDIHRFINCIRAIDGNAGLVWDVLLNIAERNEDLFCNAVERVLGESMVGINIDTMHGRFPLREIRERFIQEYVYGARNTTVPTIKEVRMITGLGLKEAKDVVDSWRMHAQCVMADIENEKAEERAQAEEAAEAARRWATDEDSNEEVAPPKTIGELLRAEMDRQENED